jgi:agmatine/peptidylarginine deiminase
MISENKTNKIYFSNKLKEDFPNVCKSIEKVLNSFNCKYAFLPKTKDIWARDYMPIQVSKGKFVEFRYDPDYLQGKYKGYRDLKTYPDIVCNELGVETIKSDIILDGGNVIKSDNCVILTDKIVVENKHTYKKDELLSKLSELFDFAKIILIPWDKKEKYGHSDGVVRFIDNERVLVSEIYEKDEKLIRRLKENGLKPEILRVKIKRQNKFNWAYINFLQTKDLIIVPKFNTEEDKKAIEVISSYFKGYKIAQVEMSEIATMGGALNCISWSINV